MRNLSFVLLLICAVSLCHCKGASESQTLSRSDLLAQWKAMPWILPSLAPSNGAEPRFTLWKRGRHEAYTIFPDSWERPADEQILFHTDLSTFIKASGGQTLQDAQIKWADGHGPLSGSFIGMRSWGGLPYPPVASGNGVNTGYDQTVPFRDTAYSDPRTQFQMDLSSDSELTRNDELDLYQNGGSFPPLMKLVNGADKFLFIEVIALNCDASTEPFIRALEEKALHGTDVRLTTNKIYALADYGCLRRLSRAGVEWATGPFHGTYAVNDKQELLIGSQAFTRTFFESNGHNFLDRDQMLWIKGPAATDALQDFLSNWEAYRSASQKSAGPLVDEIKSTRQKELLTHRRGTLFYKTWLENEPQNICRFVSQNPRAGHFRISSLLKAMTEAARCRIRFSNVKLGYSLDKNTSDAREIIDSVKAAATRGARVDYIGNGWASGDGELTMFLLGLISSHTFWKNLLEPLTINDMDRVFRGNETYYSDLLKSAPLSIWTYFNFIHYKVWTFDENAFFISGMNIEEPASTKLIDAGVLCFDRKINATARAALDLDMMNSNIRKTQ